MGDPIVFARVSGVVEATVDGDVVLMSPADGRCYALHGSGQAVWDALREPRTAAQVVERMLATFTVDPDRCATDVDALLADLERAGMLTRAD